MTRSLAELVLRNLATYVPVLAGVVARPKRTLATLLADDARLDNALVFGCTTAALGLLLQAQGRVREAEAVLERARKSRAVLLGAVGGPNCDVPGAPHPDHRTQGEPRKGHSANQDARECSKVRW